MRRYHDEEWGVPVHDDTTHFELILLEGAQAGLSWRTILNRREGYRKAFADFDPTIVAGYTPERIDELLMDQGIIRNRLKVKSAVGNAGAFLRVQEEFGGFNVYIWSFIDGRPVMNFFRSLSEIPTETEVSRAMSRDLKRRGFSFVGPTICYAYMQSVGMVNDHLVHCFRWKEIKDLYER
jgi:DNA-3-methyladenine glycosylase I